MAVQNFKAAAVTDNGITVFQHFGSAPGYIVLTVENGKITNREQRDKFNPHGAGQQHHHHDHEHGEGHGQQQMDKHQSMISNIADCQYLISRGMGYGIYNHLQTANIEPIITDIPNIEDAVQAIIDGTIINHSEKLH